MSIRIVALAAAVLFSVGFASAAEPLVQGTLRDGITYEKIKTAEAPIPIGEVVHPEFGAKLLQGLSTTK